jgi:formylglycine-generating enzyme required for sulfatase activity
MVKNGIIILLMLLSGVLVKAQQVTNVYAEQQGNILVVHYILQTDSPCEVSLHVSMDAGKTWSSPLKNVAGDVGQNIASGARSITWNVLQEQEQLLGSAIQFKVMANGKKWFEPELVFVQGGTFQMGSNSGDEDEKPAHSVTLSDFSVGKFEVTQAQWKEIMGTAPSIFSGCDNCPVEHVSWDDVQSFIQKLNARTGKSYRLPTEAEWEYAARGGNKSKGFTYSGSNDLAAVAWYDSNSGSITHPVGQKFANELRIYDMNGNVWEWCSDWYGAYSSSTQTNPKGISSGQFRVVRGGSWSDSANDCRSSIRRSYYTGRGNDFLGFRLVLSPVR